MSEITPTYVLELAMHVSDPAAPLVDDATGDAMIADIARILRNCAKALERCSERIYTDEPDAEQLAYDAGREAEREAIADILRATEG